MTPLSQNRIYVYDCLPLDDWSGWQPLDYSQKELRDLFYQGLALASHCLAWQGDLREGPFTTPLPCGNPSCKFMVGWKQDSKGTTFIVSPFPLPWLEKEIPGVCVPDIGMCVADKPWRIPSP
jgi:hypothetical protein